MDLQDRVGDLSKDLRTLGKSAPAEGFQLLNALQRQLDDAVTRVTELQKALSLAGRLRESLAFSFAPQINDRQYTGPSTGQKGVSSDRPSRTRLQA
jgi:hypothetical protein